MGMLLPDLLLLLWSLELGLLPWWLLGLILGWSELVTEVLLGLSLGLAVSLLGLLLPRIKINAIIPSPKFGLVVGLIIGLALVS